MVVSNRNLLFQGSIFRCELLVSRRVTQQKTTKEPQLRFVFSEGPTPQARKNTLLSSKNLGPADRERQFNQPSFSAAFCADCMHWPKGSNGRIGPFCSPYLGLRDPRLQGLVVLRENQPGWFTGSLKKVVIKQRAVSKNKGWLKMGVDMDGIWEF